MSFPIVSSLTTQTTSYHRSAGRPPVSTISRRAKPFSIDTPSVRVVSSPALFRPKSSEYPCVSSHQGDSASRSLRLRQPDYPASHQRYSRRKLRISIKSLWTRPDAPSAPWSTDRGQRRYSPGASHALRYGRSKPPRGQLFHWRAWDRPPSKAPVLPRLALARSHFSPKTPPRCVFSGAIQSFPDTGDRLPAGILSRVHTSTESDWQSHFLPQFG